MATAIGWSSRGEFMNGFARPEPVLAPRQVLFLCSGNYYRSRFAEILFNHRARVLKLPWRATSAGFRIEWEGKVGPISPHTVRAIEARGIRCDSITREPQTVTEALLESAQRVIAVKEAEHRNMMRATFPEWENRIEYWQVHDLDAAEPVDAIAELERLVGALIDSLRAG